MNVFRYLTCISTLQAVTSNLKPHVPLIKFRKSAGLQAGMIFSDHLSIKILNINFGPSILIV